MKGVICAGGSGSRLYPSTKVLNKHLLPVGGKPMIYYPIGLLMLLGVKEFLIVTNAVDQDMFERLLGDGKKFGIVVTIAVQTGDKGILGAIAAAEKFVNHEQFYCCLGDNIFFSSELQNKLKPPGDSRPNQIFLSPVSDPGRFGVALKNSENDVIGFVEKPSSPVSYDAVTGLYKFSEYIFNHFNEIYPSIRGELEIIDLLSKLLETNDLSSVHLGRGMFWIDAGTPADFAFADSAIRDFESRNGCLICSPEEIAYRLGLISVDEFGGQVRAMPESAYKKSLQRVLNERV